MPRTADTWKGKAQIHMTTVQRHVIYSAVDFLL
jgi:hypothetical protein